jgi:hypothetical protein
MYFTRKSGYSKGVKSAMSNGTTLWVFGLAFLILLVLPGCQPALVTPPKETATTPQNPLLKDFNVVVPVKYPASEGKANYKPTGKHGEMRLWTRIGSCMLEGEGRVEMTFKGTLLVSQFDGVVQVTGKVREEFRGMGRQVWFGEGKAVLEGRWRKIIWFGTNLQAVWKGRGLAELYGELDPVTKSSGRVIIDGVYESPWYTVGMKHYVPLDLSPWYHQIKEQIRERQKKKESEG